MIKAIIIAIWVVAVALGSVYFSLQMTPEREMSEEEKKAAYMASLDYIEGELVTVPVFATGRVHGYFLAKLSYKADVAKLENMKLAAKDMITDELFNHLVGNKYINFPKLDTFDLQGFKTSLFKALNKRAGDDVFYEVVVLQMDYIDKKEIRGNMRRKQFNMTSGDKLSEGKKTKDKKEEATH